MSNKNDINKASIYGVTSNILNQIANDLDSSATKATLANLRNSISKPYSQTIIHKQLEFFPHFISTYQIHLLVNMEICHIKKKL